MARLNRRFGWLIIERMDPSGSHTDEHGQRWADFDATIRVRRWHPGYWRALLRAWWAMWRER